MVRPGPGPPARRSVTRRDSELASPSPPSGFPLADRSSALDVLRGLTIGVLIVLVFTPTTGWRGHAAWWGWRPSDFFFPFFLFIAGAGVAHQALRRGVPWMRVARRTVLLVALGLAVNWWAAQGADVPLRWTGVLQRIAFVSLAGTLAMAPFRFRWQAAIALAIACAAAWGGLLAWNASACPSGLPTPEGCGTFLSIDQSLLGRDRVYALGVTGHDPEGIASSLGALATFLSGIAAGSVAHIFVGRRRLALTAGMGAVWLLLVPLFLNFQPVGKRMWTPAYSAVHSGAALLILSGLMLALDREGPPRWSRRATWPFQALGRNVLGIWLGLFLIDPVLNRRSSPADIPLWGQLIDDLSAPVYFTLFAGLFFGVAALLHCRRLYLRL